MADILKPKLDETLVPKSEFFGWYSDMIKKLKEISDLMVELNDLCVAVPPMNYCGRIIVSTTDDTEQKVIKHYGGKQWRRITNFLRGVGENDDGFGKKHGEEYVCLRESSVPIHTHGLGIEAGRPDKLNAYWMKANAGGNLTKIVNSSTGDSNTGLGNVDIGYQVSPIEYPKKGHVTIPHDNMPPYKEVYIWECV